MSSRRSIPFFLTAILLGAASAMAEERIAVVVSTSRAVTLSIDQIAQIYLKQRRFWQDGDPIIPVNREAGSRVRSLFSRAVLGREDSGLELYWNRQYFRGVLPPATLASDEAVKRFVGREARAIGYISASAVDDSVRVVVHLEPFPRSR